MSGPRISGSALERILLCAPSALLPQVGVELEAGRRGTAIHEYLASVPVLGRDVALEQVAPEYREACASIDLERLPVLDSNAWAAEVAWAYDPEKDTARELGRGVGRRYEGLREGEIPGTADVVGISGESAVVIDWKTGRLARRGRAADSMQLRFYALAAARAYGADSATIALVHILEDGGVWWDVAELDALDLDDVASDLRSMLTELGVEQERMAAGEVPRTVEGPHCTYCPALPHCPSRTRLAAVLATGSEDAEPVLTPETAPLVLERLEAIESVTKRVRESLELYARQQPIPLPSGEVFGPTVLERESIDPAKGAIVLAQAFSERVAMDAIESKQTITKTRLKAALKHHASETGAKVTQLEKQAHQALRDGGAVIVTTTHPVRRHKPRLPAGEEQS